MTINFSCEVCGKTLSTSDDKAGRKAKCPGCGEMLIVPGAQTATNDDDEVSDDEHLPDLPTKKTSRGNKVACPMCGEKVPAAATVCEFCGEPLEGQKRGRGHAIIETGDVITSGWNCFKAEMGISIGLVIVSILINIAAGIPRGVCYGAAQVLMKQGDQDTALILQGIGLLFAPLTYAVQIYISCGLTVGMLKIVRGESTEIGVLFQGGKFFWRAVGSSIVFGLMAFAGFLLCIVPGIIVTLMFGPFLYVLVDEDLPGIDCLWRAKTITEGNKLTYFVMGLACVLINILGAMALCVGLIFTAPLTTVIFAVAYCKMSGQRIAA